jgi:hypothetical protein
MARNGFASTVLVSPTAKTVSLNQVGSRIVTDLRTFRPPSERQQQERSLPSGFVEGVWAFVEAYDEGSIMTLQQRIDYLTTVSETIVGQLNELITLNEQLQKARTVSAIQHLAPKKTRPTS